MLFCEINFLYKFLSCRNIKYPSLTGTREFDGNSVFSKMLSSYQTQRGNLEFSSKFSHQRHLKSHLCLFNLLPANGWCLANWKQLMITVQVLQQVEVLCVLGELSGCGKFWCSLFHTGSWSSSPKPGKKWQLGLQKSNPPTNNFVPHAGWLKSSLIKTRASCRGQSETWQFIVWERRKLTRRIN